MCSHTFACFVKQVLRSLHAIIFALMGHTDGMETHMLLLHNYHTYSSIGLCYNDAEKLVKSCCLIPGLACCLPLHERALPALGCSRKF